MEYSGYQDTIGYHGILEPGHIGEKNGICFNVSKS